MSTQTKKGKPKTAVQYIRNHFMHFDFHFIALMYHAKTKNSIFFIPTKRKENKSC